MLPLPGEALAADLARRFDEVRRDGEARVRAALLTLVDVADALGRVCDDPAAAGLPPALGDGLGGLRGKVATALAAQGVDPVPAVGHPLDLRLHHVAEVCDGPGEPDAVVGQLRPGYLWNGQVLRPAEVVAVRPRQPGDSPS